MNNPLDSLKDLKEEIQALPEKIERRSIAKVLHVLVWLFDQLVPKIRAAMVAAAESYDKPPAEG